MKRRMTTGSSAPVRAAIYARMSTDKQSADSPADQIARCRGFAAARAWQVLDELVVEEAGLSGSSRHNRPGLLDLMARLDEWDVLLAWDSARLARNVEDLGWIRNRLSAAKKTAVFVQTGLDVFNVGSKVMGVFDEEYREKLRADTLRGLLGRAERGLSSGGLPYGYRSVPAAVDDRGQAVERAGRRIVVHEPEAVVLRHLFELYLNGPGLRDIAHRLNAEGTPPPRPRALRRQRPSWSPTAIREMLLNPLYAGDRIFNRSEWIKDHETGKRRRFLRPESEWVRKECPELAVISRATHAAVQAEMRRRSQVAPYERKPDGGHIATTLPGRGHRGPSRHVLSGFLECATCGGSFHAQNGAERYGCGWHRGRGPIVCASSLTVRRTALEDRIFGAIRERILVPEVVACAVARAADLVSAQLAAPEPEPAEVRARLAEIDEELATLRRVASRSGRPRELARVVAELEAERASVTGRADRPTRAGIAPDLLRAVIEARVLEMRAAFHASAEDQRAAFRGLLGDRRMRVGADPERGFRVEGVFSLALEMPNARAYEGPGRRQSVVAGGGFEPPTSGL